MCNTTAFFFFLIYKRHLYYKRNLNPFLAAIPGTPSPTATAPSTGSPRSSFWFSRTRMIRRTVAQHMAMNPVTQSTAKAVTRK